MKAVNVVIAGATGLVGGTLLRLFEENKLPIKTLRLLASEQSSGKTVAFKGEPLTIENLATFDFSGVDIAFFCISNELAAVYAPKAAAAGCIVIDKSNHFRNNPDVPLMVPEVNPHHLSQFKKTNIIANPNCTTIPIAVAVKAIHAAAGITRINIATYQAVSGTGKEAVQELREQSQHVLNDQAVTAKIYPQQIAFNVLPHIDAFEANGYTREEMKMVLELRKIFNEPHLAVNPTAVRVPVLNGHAAAVHLETRDKIALDHVKALLEAEPGLHLISGDYPYPTPVKDASGQDAVYVGRLREDISHPRGINLWVVADNLRKGAALNAVQIANQLIKDYL
ncbi:MAG TPA: aspartate-semialdehyde dehydrogenase [Gammaproteobacteria bacterium]|jgi:aspartate-semialdehyde dehydrogenase|nr:aspartate-semialdehyde dehydrogenase [Gammaproteobacteria bacterium]